MPDTLILTAEFDPLRDEGEAFGERLKPQGIEWKYTGSRVRFTGTLHWESNFCMCRRAFTYVNRFLETEEQEQL